MDFHNKSILVLSLLLSACTTEGETPEENFYTKGSGHYDVARLPIVEPHEMITASCCANWHIGRFSKMGEAFDAFDLATDVDSLFYAHDRIFIYCDDRGLRDSIPEDHYYVLNPKDSSLTNYYSAAAFRADYPIALWAASDAYYYIKENNRPPWDFR